MLTRQFQIDLIVRGDIADLLGLHDLELTAQADDYAGADGLVGLHEDRKRRECRRGRHYLSSEFIDVLTADAAHDLIQTALILFGQQFIYRAEVALFRRHLQRDIEDQRLEQVQLCVEPEGVFGIAGGVGKDDVTEGLRHQFATAHLPEAVPGVAVVHFDQIEDTNRVALIPQVLAHGLVEFRFWISDDNGLPSPGRLKDQVPGNASRLASTGGTAYGKIAVEPGLLRQCDDLPGIRQAQDVLLGLARSCQIKTVPGLSLAHEAGCAITARAGDGEVSIQVGHAATVPAKPEPEDADEGNANDDHRNSNRAFREGEECGDDRIQFQRRQAGRSAIVAACRLPSIDIDDELGNDAGDKEQHRDQDDYADDAANFFLHEVSPPFIIRTSVGVFTRDWMVLS